MAENNRYYDLSELLARPMPPAPTFDDDDCCHFCGDTHAGRHGVRLPVRYKNRVVCDHCAEEYRVTTMCCGVLGVTYCDQEDDHERVR